MANTMQDIAMSFLTPEARITGNEGFKPRVYKDTVGKNTIGYGFNIDDSTVRSLIPKDILQGKRDITQDEALGIRKTLTDRAFQDARLFVGDETFSNLTTQQRTALTDMAYNLGRNKLGEFKNLKAALKNGDYEQAGIEVLNSKYAKQVPSRAMANANLIINRR